LYFFKEERLLGLKQFARKGRAERADPCRGLAGTSCAAGAPTLRWHGTRGRGEALEEFAEGVPPFKAVLLSHRNPCPPARGEVAAVQHAGFLQVCSRAFLPRSQPGACGASKHWCWTSDFHFFNFCFPTLL